MRLTHTLADERFVVHDPASRCYRLGPESFVVGLAAEPSYALQRRATPMLRALALETGDWVFFSVQQGFEVICLSRESGHGPIPSDALRLGDRHPLGVGAGGVAILSALPDDEVEDALQETADRLNTPEFSFFCITLAIQRETGGNLAETLSNLADVLRSLKRTPSVIKAQRHKPTRTGAG